MLVIFLAFSYSPTKSEFIRAKYQMLAFVHKLPCRDDDGVTSKDLSKVRKCGNVHIAWWEAKPISLRHSTPTWGIKSLRPWKLLMRSYLKMMQAATVEELWWEDSQNLSLSFPVSRWQQLHSSVRTGSLETCLRLLSLGAQANFFHPVSLNTCSM